MQGQGVKGVDREWEGTLLSTTCPPAQLTTINATSPKPYNKLCCAIDATSLTTARTAKAAQTTTASTLVASQHTGCETALLLLLLMLWPLPCGPSRCLSADRPWSSWP